MDSYDFWYAITQGCDLPINLWNKEYDLGLPDIFKVFVRVFVVKISVPALQIHVKYRDGVTDSL